MDASNPIRPPDPALRNLLISEAVGGLVVMASAALALVVANSPLTRAYLAAVV